MKTYIKEDACKLETVALCGQRTNTINSTLKKLTIQWSNQTLYFHQNFVLYINIDAENRQLLIAENRNASPEK
jgi:hypothetical protein